VIIFSGQAATQRPQPLQRVESMTGTSGRLQPQIHLLPGELWFRLFAGKGVVAGTFGDNGIRHLLAGTPAR
jgi:hypothetical protein